MASSNTIDNNQHVASMWQKPKKARKERKPRKQVWGRKQEWDVPADYLDYYNTDTGPGKPALAPALRQLTEKVKRL